MKSWFATRKEARAELKRRKEKNPFSPDEVWKCPHSKRKKPFFVGDRIDWLNK